MPIQASNSLGLGEGSLKGFAPADAEITDVRTIDAAGGAPSLIVSWARGQVGTSDYPKEIGLLVWRYTGGPGETWNALYRIQHRPLKEVVRHGRPGHLTRTRGRVDAFALNTETGDLTGDGQADVLAVAVGTGTGYCSLFWVLTNENEGVSKIRFQDDCDTTMEITGEGLIKISSARYGKRCEYAHGCWRSIRRLRWTGTGWEQVSIRREP